MDVKLTDKERVELINHIVSSAWNIPPGLPERWSSFTDGIMVAIRAVATFEAKEHSDE